MKTVPIFILIITAAIMLMIQPAQAATYKNPVLDQDGGDVYCMKYSGAYYLYHPHGKKVHCYTSTNLVNWSYLGVVFTNADDAYGGGTTEALYAPEVHVVDGVFYMYYVNVRTNNPSDGNNRDICVVQGTSPTDFGTIATRKVMLDGTYAFLDPTFFKASDGRMFLYFKYRGPINTGSELKGRKLATPKTFDGDGKILVKSENIPYGWGSGQLEHPHMEEKNGYFILFFSWGDGNSVDENGYKICYARSGAPLGTFTLGPTNNPMMYTGQNPGVRAPGASSSVKDGNGYNWMVYRQKKDNTEERDLVTCIDRLYLHNDGTAKCTATRGTYETAPAPL